ncbi:MAG: hypothetical protein OEW68_14945 [Gammaproteobacteria bacterium]|nr:hypothetical protein [Gammaproteobacteria bacterium]MDH4316128.1 hypothetical protein [Gammaproteobacteria bacterium]MDH5214949.1 hypothetical protein [Gammaproteobacteria bacterium]MDH5502074.1 hypothetical protein [Gammaproteobacteria bacterium]
MHIRTILASILLGLSVSAAAEFTTIERAYEVPLNLLRVPASVNGTVMFKECATCEEFRVPVTERTEFLIDGESMRLRDFRRSLFRIRDRESEVVTVRRHLQSNTITAIKVTH